MQKKKEADDGDDNRFLYQFFLEIIDRSFDQITPIIDRYNLDTFGQTGF